MKAWTVANQKGGVGKTTTVISLGALLAMQGRRVLMIDLDPHGSMTSYFGLDPDHIEASVYTLFQRAVGASHMPLASMLVHTGVDGLQLLPSSTALVSLDKQFGAREGMGLVIGKTLCDWGDKFDYVLIDCPPVLGILMVNALASCDQLIIPVQTEFLAIKGLERLQHTLAMIGRSRNTALDYTIVPTMFDRRTRAAIASLRTLREGNPGHVWSGVIPVDTQFREASSRGKPLPVMRPSCRGSRAYDRLLDYLLARRLPQGDMRMAG